MVNVFSFCLYGPYNDRYYHGMVENVMLVQRHFPDWKVFVYIAPDVEQDMVNFLRSSSNVVLHETHELGAKNMIHRFFAIDEPEVDLMMVRDADSRIHWKDRWAIRDFLSHSEFIAHTIRDHEDHTAKLMGGLWGLRKTLEISIRKLYASYVEDTKKGYRLAHDQNFLMDFVYPLVVSRLLIHCSKGPLFQGEYGVLFPFEWSSDVFCGKIETNFIDRLEPTQTRLSFPSVYVRVRDDIQLKQPIIQHPVQQIQPTVFIPRPTTKILNFLSKK